MKSTRLAGMLGLALGLGGGCTPGGGWDAQPPLLLEAEVATDGTTLTLGFSEPLSSVKASGDFGPPPVTKVAGQKAAINLPKGLKPGKGYRWTAEAQDSHGNLTSVAGRFYGPNDHPASLRLNEIRVAGSGTHTDLVELLVMSPGSLGGWTLDAWATPEAHQRIILPDVAVLEGEFVVVRFKPGSDSAPGARDFWVTDPKGLSATKGLVALRPSPQIPPSEVLSYAKKPGEGRNLAESLGVTADEVDVSGCTATRTWCRTEAEPADWLLVANGCATPGAPNKLTPWTGPTATRKPAGKTKGRRPSPHGGIRQKGLPSGPGTRRPQEQEEGPPDQPKASSSRTSGFPRGPKARTRSDRPRPRWLPRPPTSADLGDGEPPSRRRGGEATPLIRADRGPRPRPPGGAPTESLRRGGAKPAR